MRLSRVQFVFMDMGSYEETRLARDDDWAKYLKEGAICYLVFYQNKVRPQQGPPSPHAPQAQHSTLLHSTAHAQSTRDSCMG